MKRHASSAIAIALVLAAGASLAQTAGRVRGATQPTAPAAAARPATSPSGLPAPSTTNPAGLNSQFPAGLTGAEATATNGSIIAGPDAAPVDPGAGTQVMGGAGGVPASRRSTGPGSGGFTAQQVAQSFLGADANRDGELTRGEAQRLSIAPYSFEEMDLNKDGIITRFEYEDGVR